MWAAEGPPADAGRRQRISADGHVPRRRSPDRSENGNDARQRVVSESRSHLRPGQYARVRAETQIVPNALLVPQRAVTELQGASQLRIAAADGKDHGAHGHARQPCRRPLIVTKGSGERSCRRGCAAASRTDGQDAHLTSTPRTKPARRARRAERTLSHGRLLRPPAHRRHRHRHRDRPRGLVAMQRLPIAQFPEIVRRRSSSPAPTPAPTRSRSSSRSRRRSSSR